MAILYSIDDFYRFFEIDNTLKSEGIVIVKQAFREKGDTTDYRQQFDGLLLSFMLRGTMKAHIHFFEYEIKKGDAIVILPQLIVEPLEASSDAEMITIGLSIDFLSNYPIFRELITNDQIRWHPIIQFSEEEQVLQKELVLVLQAFFNKQKTGRKIEILQYLIFALITVLSEEYSKTKLNKSFPRKRKHEIIDNFYTLISKNAAQHRLVSFYADKLYLTPQYLTTLLKSETGKSAIEWIDHVVTIHAKSLLKSSHLSIKEISDQLNFGDSSLFCRYFKRNTGSSPKNFRNKYYDKDSS